MRAVSTPNRRSQTAIDYAGEGRRLAGAQTTHEERLGIEQVSVTVVGGALQLEQSVAPAGPARVSARSAAATIPSPFK